jgi:hypothetical protein
VVISIDTVATIPFVVVRQSGVVEGFVTPRSVSEDDVRHMKEDCRVLKAYLKENERDFVTAFHVVGLHPIAPGRRSTINAVRPARHGKACDDVVEFFEQCIAHAQEDGRVHVICESYDGDGVYTAQLTPDFEALLNLSLYEWDISLCHSMKLTVSLSPVKKFSDPLHFLKCMRYALVKLGRGAVVAIRHDAATGFSTAGVTVADLLACVIHEHLVCDVQMRAYTTTFRENSSVRNTRIGRWQMQCPQRCFVPAWLAPELSAQLLRHVRRIKRYWRVKGRLLNSIVFNGCLRKFTMSVVTPRSWDRVRWLFTPRWFQAP